MNNGNGMMVELARFFKTASHLWGRCPCCGDLFRLSDAAISFNSEPPSDWLRGFQRKQEQVAADRNEVETWKGELDNREGELAERERDITLRERNLEKTAREMAKGMIKDDKTVKSLLADAKRQAVLRSRSTLLGHLFERLAPFAITQQTGCCLCLRRLGRCRSCVGARGALTSSLFSFFSCGWGQF